MKGFKCITLGGLTVTSSVVQASWFWLNVISVYMHLFSIVSSFSNYQPPSRQVLGILPFRVFLEKAKLCIDLS